MSSVTSKANVINQPNGGYIPKHIFERKTYDDGHVVGDIHPSLAVPVGLAVDHLAGYMLSRNKVHCFRTSLAGAEEMGYGVRARKYLGEIQGIDDNSIKNALQLVTYDTAHRHGVRSYKPLNDSILTEATFECIKVMVDRTLAYLNLHAPVIGIGIDFPGAYTKRVSSGDMDFLTRDTLVDLKCSNYGINTKQTLQLAMYYILGIHSKYASGFRYVVSLSIFNALINCSYTALLLDIDDFAMYTISQDIIGYTMKSGNPSEWRYVEPWR